MPDETNVSGTGDPQADPGTATPDMGEETGQDDPQITQPGTDSPDADPDPDQPGSMEEGESGSGGNP